MEVGRKHRAQDRLHLGDEVGIAADQPDAFAAAHLSARAGDRGFQKAQPTRRNALTQSRDALGVAGAGAQDDSPGAFAQRRQHFAFDDRLDLVGAEHRQHKRIAALREIGDGLRGLAAKLRKPGILGGIDVEAHDLKAGARGGDAQTPVPTGRRR